ncbi:hypothetical protein [Rhodovulum bhavnagarense]|uniref:hypothetical protein n=1 Tax=Rhodovulum bhavnagarense TaxID=992286 RepID=UPI001044CB8A|nr:hypothetical protein [Rhodovulum bhavnagarense]
MAVIADDHADPGMFDGLEGVEPDGPDDSTDSSLLSFGLAGYGRHLPRRATRVVDCLAVTANTLADIAHAVPFHPRRTAA